MIENEEKFLGSWKLIQIIQNNINLRFFILKKKVKMMRLKNN
jgi:hypothetical protein